MRKFIFLVFFCISCYFICKAQLANGRRLSLPFGRGLIFPLLQEGGDAVNVTYEGLFAYSLVLITLIAVIFQIINAKK